MHAGGILLGEGAVKVYPVDRPWAFVVGAVSMWPVGRQYKELAVADVVTGVAQSIPAMPLHTVDEHKLSGGFETFAEMMARRRVISDVGYMQGGAEAVALEHVGYHFGYDD